MEDINNAFSESSAPEIVFQYGNEEPITLALPAIGEGKHTLVYDIVSDAEVDANTVFKLTKSGVGPLRSSLVDVELSSFWLDHEWLLFSVPKYISTHDGGLFRIAEKANGVSLSNMLLYMNLLSFDDTQGFGEAASLSVLVADGNASVMDNHQRNVEKIKEGIMSLIEIVNANPQHSSSLSPHNIYVGFTRAADGKVDEITRLILVDIGTGRVYIDKYKSVHNFEDYLDIAKASLARDLISSYYKDVFDSLCEWQCAGKKE